MTKSLISFLTLRNYKSDLLTRVLNEDCNYIRTVTRILINEIPVGEIIHVYESFQ